jgi:hypothetical protein
MDHVYIDDIVVLASNTPTITINQTGYVSDYGSVVAGSNSTEHTYTVSGSNLTNDITVTAPADFLVSKTSGSGFASSVTLTQAGGTVASTTIYARYSPASATGASGALNITNSSIGATTQNVATSGAAVATEPTTSGTISFGTATGGSIPVNLPTVGNGSRRIIVAKAGSAVSFTPADGTAMAGVNANFGAATDQAGGNKVVYDGTGSGSNV